jgi:hypothetical protein
MTVVTQIREQANNEWQSEQNMETENLFTSTFQVRENVRRVNVVNVKRVSRGDGGRLRKQGV